MMPKPVVVNLSYELILKSKGHSNSLKPHTHVFRARTATQFVDFPQNMDLLCRIWWIWSKKVSMIAIQGFVNLYNTLRPRQFDSFICVACPPPPLTPKWPTLWNSFFLERNAWSRYSDTNIANIAKYCQILPNIAKICQTLPNIAKYCQILPNIAKHCQIMPNTAKHCQILPKIAKDCQILPKVMAAVTVRRN